jgi:hypothetical protein
MVGMSAAIEQGRLAMKMRGSRLRVRLLLLAISAGQPAAAMAEVLVLRSVGPSARNYPPGRRLPDNAALALRGGDSVTILRSSGTRVLRGPGTFRVDAPMRLRTSGIDRSSGVARGVRIGTGVTRGLGTDAPRPPEIWLIDAAVTQIACVRAAAPVTLWRAVFDQSTDVVVTADDSSTRLLWEAGSQRLTLPSSARTGDGAVIEVGRPRAARAVRITLARIDVSSDSPETVALGLLSRNCRDQLDTFAALNNEETAGQPD